MPATADLAELTRAECIKLLMCAGLGRIVFTDAAMPAVEPVAFALEDEEVVFCTVPGSKLADLDRSVVGFQADDFDPVGHTGWSVLGIGQAYEITDLRRVVDIADRHAVLRAPNESACFVAVPLQHLMGHRSTPAPAAPNGAPHPGATGRQLPRATSLTSRTHS